MKFFRQSFCVIKWVLGIKHSMITYMLIDTRIYLLFEDKVVGLDFTINASMSTFSFSSTFLK